MVTAVRVSRDIVNVKIVVLVESKESPEFAQGEENEFGSKNFEMSQRLNVFRLKICMTKASILVALK